MVFILSWIVIGILAYIVLWLLAGIVAPATKAEYAALGLSILCSILLYMSLAVHIPSMANLPPFNATMLVEANMTFGLHEYDALYYPNATTTNETRQLCRCNGVAAGYTQWIWQLVVRGINVSEAEMARIVTEMWAERLVDANGQDDKNMLDSFPFHHTHHVEIFNMIDDGSCHTFNVTQAGGTSMMLGYEGRHSYMACCPTTFFFGYDNLQQWLACRTVPLYWWLDDLFNGGKVATRQRNLFAVGLPCRRPTHEGGDAGSVNILSPPPFCYVGNMGEMGDKLMSGNDTALYADQ